MRTRQGPTAQLRVVEEGCRRQLVDAGRYLHVAQVAPVVVDTRRLVVSPAQEQVARSLHESLTFDDASGVVVVRAPSQVRLEDRRLRLFDLEDERVVGTAPLQERDPAPCPDAADADDLAGGIRERELVEEMPDV